MSAIEANAATLQIEHSTKRLQHSCYLDDDNDSVNRWENRDRTNNLLVGLCFGCKGEAQNKI